MSEPPAVGDAALDALDIPEDARTVLIALREGGVDALDPNLVGIYLRGSLALGDFDPETSDIDFLAVTERRVNDEEFARLKVMHEGIAVARGMWAGRLEGAYLDSRAVHRFDAEP